MDRVNRTANILHLLHQALCATLSCQLLSILSIVSTNFISNQKAAMQLCSRWYQTTQAVQVSGSRDFM